MTNKVHNVAFILPNDDNDNEVYRYQEEFNLAFFFFYGSSVSSPATAQAKAFLEKHPHIEYVFYPARKEEFGISWSAAECKNGTITDIIKYLMRNRINCEPVRIWYEGVHYESIVFQGREEEQRVINLIREINKNPSVVD